MSLEGKLALVTGASMPHGIGRAAALALARDGADVAVTGFNNMDGVKAVAEEIRAMGRKSLAVRMISYPCFFNSPMMGLKNGT